MTEIAMIMGANALAVTTMMGALWLVSMPLKDVSFIDAFWAFGFVLIAALSFLLTPASVHGTVLMVITAIWGLRLGGYLFWRWRKHGVDKRYARILKGAKPGQEHWFTLKIVFGLQGVLMFIVSLPVQLGQMGEAETLGLLALAGITLAVIGIAFETIGDWQLTHFKSKPENDGQVMDRGLWRYTRHPNYFGDCCLWWGLYLIAVDSGPLGLLAIPGPLLMTFLLVKWSGAGLLEKGLRKTKPQYKDYIARTSGFIPWPPKTLAEDDAR